MQWVVPHRLLLLQKPAIRLTLNVCRVVLPAVPQQAYLLLWLRLHWVADTGGSVLSASSVLRCYRTKANLRQSFPLTSSVAFASSLDQIGPIAKNAQDCAWILNAIAGFDPHDGTSSKRNPEDYTAKLEKTSRD